MIENQVKKIDSVFLGVYKRLEEWEKSGLGREDPEEARSETVGDGKESREHHWFKRIIKNYLWIEASFQSCLKKWPKDKIRRVLFVAAGEYLAEPESLPKIVDFTVNQAAALRLSKPERGMINAVLRRMPEAFAGVEARGPRWSHPQFLLERWEKQLGKDGVLELLKSNQQEAKNWLHTTVKDRGLAPSRIANFYELKSPTDWDLARDILKEGKGYIQDPATSYPIILAGLKGSEKVLDLCSSPGGKSWQILQQLDTDGQLVSVDLPGPKLKRLESNLARGDSRSEVKIIGSDLYDLEEHLPVDARFDVVVLDVPCSNTGVICRKPTVKYRLRKSDFLALTNLQKDFINIAAKWVKSGGKLIYSTCSVDREENQDIVHAFLKENPDFSLKEEKLSYPHIDGHDGGGAFLLTKSRSQNSTIN